MNKLFYGDNLGVLRESIATESVDLIYLDPPFNSNASYNVLFKAPDGSDSQSQIEAFDDTWQWGEVAEDAYWQVLNGPNTDAARMLEAMRGFLRENALMAYLAMMAIRLVELHRVLKRTGSLYLHCDPTASHYLKILLDAVFGADHFQNEITWKRRYAHSDGERFGNVSDIILFYSKSDIRTWNPQFQPYELEYIKNYYRYADDDGKKWLSRSTTAPGGRGPTYEWNGHIRAWRYTKDNMEKLHAAGKLFYTKNGIPRFKQYLEDMPGMPAQNIWSDIKPLNSWMPEQLGYPTQKPVALLERIISASSNPGDVVLDPFCGCGTTVHAAQKLGRQWIGIDVTHLAISLIERRLRDAFGKDVQFTTYGVPRDVAVARDLAERDKHEFEKWAISLIPNAQPFRGGRKGADTGIDGIVYMRADKGRTERAIVEVKGGGVKVDQIHKLKSVIEREKALIGLFVTLLKPTRDMVAEAAAAGFVETNVGRFPRIQILTIEGILDGRESPRLPVVDTSAFKQAPKEKIGKQASFDL